MILVDRNEPLEILKALQQTVPASQYANLNQLHMSDFFFVGVRGKFQFSRKQSGELLGNLDEAERQIRDYYDMADRNYQIVEGIISPIQIGNYGMEDLSNLMSIRDNSGAGGLHAYKVELNGYVRGGRQFPGTTASMLYAWIHRLAEFNIPTYFTMHWGETARLLSAIYKNEQKPIEDHHTMQRVITTKLHLESTDPFVLAMCALSSALKLGIGEDRACKLRDAGYASVRDILDADPQDLMKVKGIGKMTVERMHYALGRRSGRPTKKNGGK